MWSCSTFISRKIYLFFLAQPKHKTFGGSAMREFPSCFGENGVQVADSSSSSTTRASQNAVTCVYLCKLRGRSCLITVSWTKTLMGQGLSVGIVDYLINHCLCKVEIKPWLFSRRKGSKNLDVQYGKIEVFWDLSCAKFGSSGPEPLEGFYLAVVFNKEMVLLLGDLKQEACKKINSSDCAFESYAHSGAIFIGKRENIFGKKFYGAKVQFFDKGQVHDVTIECDTVGINNPCLVIRIDSKTVMQVKRLKWKFRGNHTILVDGVPVEVFWDVHNWLFGNAMGNAVFLFQTCVSTQKLWEEESASEIVNMRMVCTECKGMCYNRSPGGLTVKNDFPFSMLLEFYLCFNIKHKHLTTDVETTLLTFVI